MECNKDEASRAKEIAEQKFAAKDIVIAKKFALKAQNLYPALEGINQMLATLDVYISAEKKINGDADWYSVLSVDPLADEETVRKQFRKLALTLHPDKNKSIGADGAFKLISEAWSLLSDKAKRLAYDTSRKVTLYRKVSTSPGSSSGKSGINGFNHFTQFTTTNIKTQKSNNRSCPTSTNASQKLKGSTFWSVCHGCETQYEYFRAYFNHNLRCPNCSNTFFAVETPPPITIDSKPTPLKISQQRKNLNHQATEKDSLNQGRNTAKSQNAGVRQSNKVGSYDQSTFRWNPFSESSSSSSAAQFVSMVKLVNEKENGEGEEAQAATKRGEALQRKHHSSKKTSDVSSRGGSTTANRKRGINDISTSACDDRETSVVEMESQPANLTCLLRCTTTKDRLNAVINPSSIGDVSNLLMKKARQEINKKLNEWKSAAPATIATKKWNSYKNVDGKRDKIVEQSDTNNHNKHLCSPDLGNGSYRSETVLESSGVNGDKKVFEPKSIDVPDSDFHEFDKDRTEKSFVENQVWAAYDNEDGMPRYYAMIHNVISLNPFKMQMSWLNSKTNSELGSLNWVSSGFSKTCGDFRLGKYEIYSFLNSFSHKVRWTKGTRGAISIYPMKGDVWALYKNWSPDWNELTADEVIHIYEMVEVIEDYNEELGVSVFPLVKVAGFRTVFHQYLESTEIRKIPREEMFRFSHSVPSYLLTGREATNAPKGCLELDPAASPLDNIKGSADAMEIDIVGSEDVKEESMLNKPGKDSNCFSSETGIYGFNM